MSFIPQVGGGLREDSLVFAATTLIAFGLGQRMSLWLSNQAYAAPLFYAAILFFIYASWIYKGHRGGN